jgi:TRAP-type C4-dicarboxylate transport system permease small subunit
LQRALKVLSQVTNKGVLLAIGVLTCTMTLVVANVFARSLGGSIAPTYEITGLMSGVIIAFALVYTMLEKGHVVVTVLVFRLPQRTQAILTSITSLAGLAIWLVVAWSSFDLAYQRGLREVTPVLGFYFLPVRYILVFALILLCSVLLIDSFEALRRSIRK